MGFLPLTSSYPRLGSGQMVPKAVLSVVYSTITNPTDSFSEWARSHGSPGKEARDKLEVKKTTEIEREILESVLHKHLQI